MHCGLIDRFSFYQPFIDHAHGSSVILLLLQELKLQHGGRVYQSHLREKSDDTPQGARCSDAALNT